MTPARRFVALALVLLAGCSSTTALRDPDIPPDAGDYPKPRYVPAGPSISPVALSRFDSCAPIRDYLRSEGAKRATAWGLPGMGFGRDVFGGAVAVESRAGSSNATADAASFAAPASGAGGGGFSTTNVQEAGVDEPDIVKTDGRRILAIARGRLHWIDVDGDEPRRAGSLTMPQNVGISDMLVHGTRAIVFGYAPIAAPALERAWAQSARSSIFVVDVTKPDAMRVLTTIHLEGSYVAARMVDGVARVVLRSAPAGIEVEYPRDGTPAETRRATNANRREIRSASLDDWLPNFVVEDRRGPQKKVSQGRVSSCDRVHRTKRFAGFGATTVLTLDPFHPTPRNGVTVLGDAGAVYASAERLYVATNEFDESPAILSNGTVRVDVRKIVTQIHSFDIRGRTDARYLASGVVTGHVLNQWSLSEHEGALRVASTFPQVSEKTVSESFVTVLAQRGGSLAQIGRIGGLGKTERIYGVRFMGDRGYVVTFRQVDPLYVLDLADPAKPTLRGELKIPGYSAYLHPVGDGLLLGVGAAATNDGRRTGMQLSVFDVRDPAKPTRVHLHSIENAYSEVEHSHLSFLWWEPKKLALIPVNGAGDVAVQSSSSKPAWTSWMEGFRVDERTGIDSTGRIGHEFVSEQEGHRWQPPVQRAVVVGGRVYTFSEAGMMASDIDSLAREAWIEWPAHPQQPGQPGEPEVIVD